MYDRTDLKTEPIAATKHWLEQAVIGLNLCPFAKAVHLKQQIRWALSPARDAETLLAELVRELQILAAADPEQHDTTLLIHPHALTDFLDYNDFLDLADAVIEELGLDGVLQVASFHPDYQFEGTEADDPGNLRRFGTTHLTGNLDRNGLIAAYERESGRRIQDPVFLFAYGMFKLAGIMQQIYARYRRGSTEDPRFAGLIALVHDCGNLADRAIRLDRISGLAERS